MSGEKMEKPGNDSQDDRKEVENNRVDTDYNNRPHTSTAPFHDLTTRIAGRSDRKRINAWSSGSDNDDRPAAKIRKNDNSDAVSDERCFYEWRSTHPSPPTRPSPDRGRVSPEPAPQPTFFEVHEIVHRQIGLSKNFQGKFYGSVPTIKRINLLKTFLISPEPFMGSLLMNMHPLVCPNTIEFNKTGDLIASGSEDLTVCVWDWARGTSCKSYRTGHEKHMYQASWLPHVDSKMVTCAMDGQVRLLDFVSGMSRNLALHKGACYQFALHPATPDVVISTGDDGIILSADVRCDEPTKLATVGNGNCTSRMYTIHSNPRNCNEICVAGSPSTISVFDRRNPSESLFQFVPDKFRNVTVSVNTVTYNHDGTEILASYDADDIYLFDTVTLHPTGNYAHHYCGRQNGSRNIKGVNYFGQRSEFIVSGSDTGNIFFWDKKSETVVRRLRGNAPGMVNFIKPHPSIPVLASCGLAYDVKIWAPDENGEKLDPECGPYATNVLDRKDGLSMCSSSNEPELTMSYRPYQQRSFRKVYLQNIISCPSLITVYRVADRG